MYITFFAGSPCAKTVSLARNLPTFLPRPVESRNNFTSKAGLFEIAFRGERRTLKDSRRAAENAIRKNSTAFVNARRTFGRGLVVNHVVNEDGRTDYARKSEDGNTRKE